MLLSATKQPSDLVWVRCIENYRFMILQLNPLPRRPLHPFFSIERNMLIQYCSWITPSTCIHFNSANAVAAKHFIYEFILNECPETMYKRDWWTNCYLLSPTLVSEKVPCTKSSHDNYAMTLNCSWNSYIKQICHPHRLRQSNSTKNMADSSRKDAGFCNLVLFSI